MADEIKLRGSLIVEKGTLKRKRIQSLSKFTLTASDPQVSGGTQKIGTAAGGEAIGLNDVTTVGWAYLKNLDGTNFIEVGAESGGTFHPAIKLLAGEWCFVPLTGTPFARADTAEASLEFEIYDR